MKFPFMSKISQELARRPLQDIEAELDVSLDIDRFGALLAGPRIALAVGSRHIDGIAPLVSSVIGRLRSSGLDPFILPAMGSHGGATAQGQEALLESIGITPEAMGAVIEPSMETVRLGTTDGGVEVFSARAAMEADGIVLFNRVGLHTGFSGPTQSGVVKMLVVGLGKADGAKALHQHGFGAGHLIAEAAELVLQKAPPVVALAALEDGTRKLSELRVMAGVEIIREEPSLLERAIDMWPHIPVPEADLLIVEEIGKDISGIGMDPHVTGRGKDLAQGAAPPFAAKRLVVLRLTRASAGNATGIGHADITTQAFVDAIDNVVTYRNVITSGALHRARVPIVAATDREAVEMALSSLSGLDPERARVLRIKNTRHLEEFEASSELLPVLARAGSVRVESEGKRLSFRGNGDLV